MIKWLLSVVVAFPLAAGAVTAADAEDMKVDATISIQSTSIGAGLGVQWGGGTVEMADGKTYGIRMRGLSLLEAGVTRVSASGEVFNLDRIEDIEGIYNAVEAGGTAATGRNIVRMENDRGVIIHMRATTQGVGLKLAAEGVRIQLRDAR